LNTSVTYYNGSGNDDILPIYREVTNIQIYVYYEGCISPAPATDCCMHVY